MSSLQNSESTPLKRREQFTKKFHKYGMTFTYHLNEITEPEWAMVAQDNVPSWTLSGDAITTSYVSSAVVQDEDQCARARPIYLYSTADGPILGIEHERSEKIITLLDPCAVLFDGQSKINLLPIFNVGRFLDLYHSAVRAVQPPSEILLAAYPGFLIQNRMARFQLKAHVPLVTTPELTNDGV